MKTLHGTSANTLLRFEFEYRIFFSLAIVIACCGLCFGVFAAQPTVAQWLGRQVGIALGDATTLSFLTLAVALIPISLLRMWAGSLLSSGRVMSFAVVDDALIMHGPYTLSRNPIYLADLLAIGGFSLCLPWPAIAMPVLFVLHYRQLIRYEEQNLARNFPDSYPDFIASAPMLVPSRRGIAAFAKALRQLSINADGFRYNALYVLFTPGLIAAAFSGSIVTALVIGTPAVIYWAVMHTIIGVSKSPVTKIEAKSKALSGVLYAQCWEDPQLDRAAFHIQSDDVVFSITSGGCNALSFLLDNPRKVIALDLNPHQNHLLELKMAAIRTLAYEQCLAFMGVTDASDRVDVYDTLRSQLSHDARLFWDAHLKLIHQGLTHCGRFEWYLKLIRKGLHVLVGAKTIDEFFRTTDFETLNTLYERRWNTRRWKLFIRVIMSRRLMSMLFDKNFFRYVTEDFSFGQHFAEKTRRALTMLPLRSNYFLSYMLLGRYYSRQDLPSYLRAENYELLRSRLDRIEIVTDSCEHFFASLPDDSISRFNFTNIFEWMSHSAYEDLLRQTMRVARNHAVMTYRNLLVSRKHPMSLDAGIRSHDLLAASLHRADRSFIYNQYIVEEILKESSCVTPPVTSMEEAI